MPTVEPERVKFRIVRNGYEIECIGHFKRDSNGPYAENCVEISGDVPIAQARVPLFNRFLIRAHNTEQGLDFYNYAKIVTLDQ
jgi:hypothetical protein